MLTCLKPKIGFWGQAFYPKRTPNISQKPKVSKSKSWKRIESRRLLSPAYTGSWAEFQNPNLEKELKEFRPSGFITWDVVRFKIQILKKNWKKLTWGMFASGILHSFQNPNLEKELKALREMALSEQTVDVSKSKSWKRIERSLSGSLTAKT